MHNKIKEIYKGFFFFLFFSSLATRRRFPGARWTLSAAGRSADGGWAAAHAALQMMPLGGPQIGPRSTPFFM